MLERCEDESGTLGWRWNDGQCFVGDNAFDLAMAEGARLDPEGFAAAVKGTDYVAGEVVTASKEVKWDIPEGDEVIYLD